MISPLPVAGKPVILGDDPVAVQLKVVPDRPEVSRTLVVCPEQTDGVVEVMIILGNGLTVTV